MKKNSLTAGAVLAVITFIICVIVFREFDSSGWILSAQYALVVLVVSIPSARLCRYLIVTGDKIEKKLNRALYYLALPTVSALIALVLFTLSESFTGSAHTLGEGLMRLFLILGVMIAVMVPSLQTLIALLLRRITGTKPDEA